MERVAELIAKYPRWLALLAGGISATGFAPLNLWFLTLLCLALLMHLIASARTGKRALLLGWLFGVGHFSVGNNWIATAFTYQAAMPAWLGWVAVVLLALYLAAYPALAAWGAWWLSQIPSRLRGGGVRAARDGGGSRDGSGAEGTPPPPAFGWSPSPQAGRISLPFIFAFAGCWIITEWLRSWVFTGFAWNPLGAVLLHFGSWTGFATDIGTYGLSAIVILWSGAFANIGPTARKPEPSDVPYSEQDRWNIKGAVNAGVALIMLLGFLAVFTLVASLFRTDDDKYLDRGPWVTVVQPNISQIDKHNGNYEASNFARLARQSSDIGLPRLLLWPEAAIPWFLEDGYSPNAYWNQPGGTAAGTRATLARLLGPDDILLTGADRLEFDERGKLAGARNSVLAVDAKGQILAHYDKAHLVPYGEYLALRWLLEPLGATRLVPGDLDFMPGPGPRTLDLGPGKPKVGLQICYEMIFSGQVVDRAHRPDFIFNPSNDAWFGSWGPPQHLAQARLRAIEEGLPVVRSTPTGISAVIDADGRIVEGVALGKAGRIDAQLPLPKKPTLFARYGNALPLGFAALLIALSFLPLARARFAR